MNIFRVTLVLVAALLLAAAVGFVAPRAAAEDRPDTLYISPMEISRTVRARMRLTNVSPAAGDIYDLTYSVIDAETGVLVASFLNVPIRPGQTLDIDLGKAIDNQRAELDIEAPRFAGRVSVIVLGSGGFTHVFGRESIVPNAFRARGRTLIESHLRWEEN